MGLKRWAHGKQKIRHILGPNEQMRNMVLEALEWCLEDRGLSLSEETLAHARLEVAKYPSLNVGQFVEAYFNLSMQSYLNGED